MTDGPPSPAVDVAKVVGAMRAVVDGTKTVHAANQKLRAIDEQVAELTGQLAAWMITNGESKLNAADRSYKLLPVPKARKPTRVHARHVLDAVRDMHGHAEALLVETEMKRLHVVKNCANVTRSIMGKDHQ